MEESIFGVPFHPSIEVKSSTNGIYCFDLPPEFCSHISSEIDNNQFSNIKPSTLHDDGIIINDHPALFSKCSSFVEKVLSPISKQLFPSIIREEEELDFNDFLVFALFYRFSLSDKGIDKHIDESIITFNICIGKEFKGGELEFEANNNNNNNNENDIQKFPQSVGQCVAHLGSIPHHTHDVLEGERVNIIFWCKKKPKIQIGPKFCDQYISYLKYIDSDPAINKIGFEVPSIRHFISLQSTINDSRTDIFIGLPQNVQAKIVTLMDPEDFFESSSVCHKWNDLFRQQSLWLASYVLRFGKLDETETSSNYKEIYQLKYSKTTKRNIVKYSRSVVSIATGGIGVGIGRATWRQYCLEHSLDDQTGHSLKTTVLDENISTFFSERRENVFTPRALLCDLDPSSFSGIPVGYRKFYRNMSILHSSESDPFVDGAYTFATGKITAAPYCDRAMDRIRLLSEECDSVQGFNFAFSLAGGTGSGLTHSLVEKMADYSKKSFMANTVFPNMDETSSAFYNSVLAINSEQWDFRFCSSPSRLREIAINKLGVPWNSDTMNHIMARNISLQTIGLRFESALNTSMTEYSANLIPYPSLNFVTTSMAPLIPFSATPLNRTVAEVTNETFTADNMLMNFNPSAGKYMGCVLQFQGNVVPKDVMAAVASIKTKRTIQFVDWGSTSFKCGIQYLPPCSLPGSPIGTGEVAAGMMCNNTAMRHPLRAILNQFNELFDKRAFVHHYIYEGMEIDEFFAARTKMEETTLDYTDVDAETVEEEVDTDEY